MKVTPNSFVTIDYVIRAGDDERYPKTGEPENMSFPMGFGLMPAPLEEAMVGMSLNEEKTVRLSPQQAFGEVDQELIQEVPRGEFDPSTNPEPGDVFETEDEEGHPVYFVVKSSGPENVVIDFNHPLAGKEVEFAITLKEVREATPEDVKGCSCSECGGSHSHDH
ncbi:MAG: peptidylprolyl isomerase [Desulfobaccales bacterium]